MEHSAPPRRMKDGFLERGAQVTRVEAFVDAAFAFALTLLVISVDRVPASLPELVDALKGVPAFAFSFLQVAMFWYAHSRWSRRYGLDDPGSVWLSLLLVFLVMVYVYPLKILFGTFFSWISGGWIPWPLEQVDGYGDIKLMFMIYGIAFCTLSLCMAALFGRARRLADEIGLGREERARTIVDVVQWRLSAFIGALSALCAFLMPERPAPWLAGLPGMVYFLMNLHWPVSRMTYKRALRKTLAATP